MPDEDLDAEEVAVAAGTGVVLPVNPGWLIKGVVSLHCLKFLVKCPLASCNNKIASPCFS